MKGLLKKLITSAAFAALLCGTGFAQNGEPFAHSGAYIVEDTTRDILAAMHSRFDAFRKVALPEANVRTAGEETAATVESGVAATADSSALGSLILPEYEYINCGSRYLNRFWGGGLGTWQDMDDKGEYSGYKYDGKGVILGFDRAAGAAVFGIAASYVKGDFDLAEAVNHNSEIKQYSGHVYATYNGSRGFFAALTGGYTYGDAEIDERNAATAFNRREEYKSHTFNAGLRVGFDFEPADSIIITPSVGGNFFHSRSNRHDGNFNGDAYRLSEMKHNLVELPFDIQIAKEFDFGKGRSLRLSANGGYAYNLNDKGADGDATGILVPGNTFRIVDRKLGRSTWKAGAGARLTMDQWDIGVKYDFLTRSDFDSHRVMGTIGFSF